MGKSWLEVVDRDGWRKKHYLKKNIVYIGSHTRNDIILENDRGANVADLHAQLIATNGGSHYQLVNLANVNIIVGPDSNQPLPPHTSINIADNETFILGEFTLIFHSEGSSSSSVIDKGSSKNIGLSMAVPQPRLMPNRSMDGVIKVSNLGEKSGVKFNLELEGIDSGCYDIEPGPLLSARAEQDVLVRLHHRGTKPIAGSITITIYATAPRAYPAELATVSQVLEIMPYYRHALKLVPDPNDKRTTEKEADNQEDQIAGQEAPDTDIESERHKAKKTNTLTPTPTAQIIKTEAIVPDKDTVQETLPETEKQEATVSSSGIKHWWSVIIAFFLTRKKTSDSSATAQSGKPELAEQVVLDSKDTDVTNIQSDDKTSSSKPTQVEAETTSKEIEDEITPVTTTKNLTEPEPEPVLEAEATLEDVKIKTTKPEDATLARVDDVEHSDEFSLTQIEAEIPVADEKEILEVNDNLMNNNPSGEIPSEAVFDQEEISEEDDAPSAISATVTEQTEQESKPQPLEDDWFETNTTDEKAQVHVLTVEDDNLWMPAEDVHPNVIKEDLWTDTSILEDKKPSPRVDAIATDENTEDDIWSLELESTVPASQQVGQVLTLKGSSSAQIANTSFTDVKSDLSSADTEDWWSDSDPEVLAPAKKNRSKSNKTDELGKQG